MSPADVYTVTFNADLNPFGLTKFIIKEEDKPVRMMEDWFVSDRIMDRVKDSFILNEIMGSDHCPVGIEIDI